MKKSIEVRIKQLEKEKEVILEESNFDGSEMKMIMAMQLLRISGEIKFLSELLTIDPDKKIPSDKEIDGFFPSFGKETNKEIEIREIKRNAVKSFIKNKMQ